MPLINRSGRPPRSSTDRPPRFVPLVPGNGTGMTTPRVVIVGAGFAGYHAAKRLSRLARGRAEIVLLNSTDYFLYLPLLPEVAAGVLEPTPDHRPAHRHAARRTGDRSARWTGSTCAAGGSATTAPEGDHARAGLRPARPRRRQRQQAAAHPRRDRARARLPWHARGGLPARPRGPPDRVGGRHGRPARAGRPQHVRGGRRRLHRHRGGRARAALHRLDWPPSAPGSASGPGGCCSTSPTGCCPNWTSGCRVTAQQVLDARGVDVRMGTSVKEATADGVRLSDGEYVPTRSLIWCVGVRPDPLVADLGLPTEKGPADRGRVPRRARLPRGVRLRRRRRGARPDPPRARSPR